MGEEIAHSNHKNHLYKDWIETYSSKQTQESRKRFEEFLNSYEVNEEKFEQLNKIFATTTKRMH